jgi:hypothetical protein
MSGKREAQAAADRGAVNGPDHRLVHLAESEDDVVEQFHGPQRDAGEGESVDIRDAAGIDQIRPRAKAGPGTGDHDHARVVVPADLL